MKIAVVNRFHPDDVLGGSEVQCHQLQMAWRKLGHEVIYISLDGCGQAGFVEKSAHLRLGETLQLSHFKRLKDYLVRENFDVVYLRSFNQLFGCALSARLARVPCVYNTCNVTDLMPFQGSALPMRPVAWMQHVRGIVNRLFNWRTLSRIPVVTINQEHEKALKNRGGQAQCIYNSMVDRFPEPPPPKEKIVCWVANLKERKNPEVFMHLVRKLSGKGWRFMMVGDIQTNSSSYLQKIEGLSKLCPDFEFKGKQTVEEVDALLSRASLFVSTCRPEGFGNNLIQAWLNECPTVSLEFDADGIMEREGIGFCPGHFEGLVEKTSRLMEDDKLRISMGRRARQWALENHGLENNAKKYIDFFESII